MMASQRSGAKPMLSGVTIRKSALMAVVVGLMLAMYTLRFATAVQPGVTHDDAEYLVLAESFATGRPYRLINYPDAPLETVWPPGYPLIFLTLPWLLFGPDITALRMVNVLLAALSVVVGYALLRKLLDSSLAALGAVLFALNPRWIGLATLTMSDVAFTLLVLSFLLVFMEMETGRLKPSIGLSFSTLLLAGAILTRYWGVAFLGAAVLYLLWRKNYRHALIISVGTALLLLPFVIFLALQKPTSTGSFFAVVALQRAGDLSNLTASLMAYWRATPLTLVPVLGPTAEAKLAAFGLAWLIGIVHSVLLVIVGIGFVASAIQQRFLGLAVLCYFMLLLLLTGHIEEAEVFDEPRYLVPVLPFLYGYLILGARVVLQRALGDARALQVATAGALALVVILTLRNVQQSRATFPVADLSAGAAWAQASTDERAVFMTPDPVSRYIYLRRHTVPYPTTARTPEVIWKAIARWGVDYIVVAPPLTINRVANIQQQPDPWIQTFLAPVLQDKPDCFKLVFQDEVARTRVYAVASTCPDISTPSP